MENRNIFRRDFIEAQNDSLNGTILIRAGFRSWLWVALSLMLILSIVLFVALGSYARKVQIEGIVVSSNGVTDIVSEKSGYVSEIFVSEGERVEKGDNLFVVNHDRYDIEGRDITLELVSSLKRQLASLRQQVSYEASMNKNEIESTRVNVQLVKEELDAARKALALTKKRSLLKRKEADSYEKLYRNEFISEFAYQALLIDLSELESFEEDKQLIIKQLIRQRNQLEYKLQYLILQGELREGELLRLIDDIHAQIVELMSSRITVVRAPVSGYIAGSKGKVGQTISGDYILASIIPENSELLVELYAPSHSIGFIREQQRVGLRFSAFPYEKFGIQSGRIEHVSRSTLSLEEVTKLRSEVTSGQEALFRILVSLDKETVTVYGTEKSLKIGMVVSADINVERRRLSEWLLGPINGLQRKTLWN